MGDLTEILRHEQFSLVDLPKVAASLARQLPVSGVVAVHGEMGVGKTTMIRALLQIWGAEEEGASPTFGLVHHHQVHRGGKHAEVRHMDLYRLQDEEEAERSGIAEMLEQSGLSLVEWPERVPGLMPEDAWLLLMQGTSDGTRTCILSKLGS